jgi:Na+/citrate or Na+/malate symporter
MAGVAGPMLRDSRWEGVRFLIGLAVGGITAGLVLAIPVYLIGSLLRDVLSAPGRLALLALVVAALAIVDLLDRTPHISRQVPQRLARTLPAGTLGLVWGFDLGLLFTTQKTVSLIWAAIAAAILLAPVSAPGLLVAVAFTASAMVSFWSLSRYATITEGRTNRSWVRRARWVSGAAMLLLALSSVWLASQA